MTQPDVHGAIVRSLTDTQRERLRGIDLTNIADAVIRELGLRVETRGHTHVAISGPIITERYRRYVTDWTTDEGNHP